MQRSGDAFHGVCLHWSKVRGGGRDPSKPLPGFGATSPFSTLPKQSETLASEAPFPTAPGKEAGLACAFSCCVWLPVNNSVATPVARCTLFRGPGSTWRKELSIPFLYRGLISFLRSHHSLPFSLLSPSPSLNSRLVKELTSDALPFITRHSLWHSIFVTHGFVLWQCSCKTHTRASSMIMSPKPTCHSLRELMH